jgi:hypothetical protein
MVRAHAVWGTTYALPRGPDESAGVRKTAYFKIVNNHCFCALGKASPYFLT